MTPTAPVGWAVLGCGWLAADFVAPALLRLQADGRASAVALYDRDPARAQALAAQLPGATVARSVEEAVSAPGVDAVYVATPNHAHLSGVRAAATAGRAVLVEKPLAVDVAAAREAVAVTEAAGVLAGTAFDQRFHPAHARMRELIATGALGTVTAVRIVYGCWLPRDWSGDGSAAENWRVDPVKAGGGAGIDLAPHAVDLTGSLLGEDLTDLLAQTATAVHDYPVDDSAMLLGRTAAGVLATISVSYALPDALPRRRLEIVGTAGQLTALDTMGQTPGGSLRFTDAADGTSRPVDFDAASSPFVLQLQAFSAAVRGHTWPHPITRDLQLHALLLGALDAGGIRC